VYIVRCTDGSLYTGVTNAVDRRLEEHNSGRGSRYTRSRRPVSLAYLEKVPDRRDALKVEARIKKLSRSEKIGLCRRYDERLMYGFT